MKLLNGLKTLLPGRRLISRKALRTLSPADLLLRSRALAKAVYVGDRTVLCRVLGRYRLYVASDDVGFGVHVMLDGIWEHWLTSFMARRITPGMRVIDVGANHGYYTVMFGHLTGPTGQVAAIEPHPRTVALLGRSIYANGFQAWTTVIQAAATAEDDVELYLHVPDHEPKNAHVTRDAQASGIAVRGATLTTLLADWPRVDFLKIDVEGAEEACLAGAWPIIQRDRPDMVLEFNASRCTDPAGLLDRLTEVYGSVGVIGKDGRVMPASRTALLDSYRLDDWMLFLSLRR